MRKALVEAGHHAKHRTAFGALLIDQPLMRNVLADLALESEAATDARPAAGRRGRPGDPRRRRTSRRSAGSPPRSASTGSPSAARRFAAEALECLGGNGYVEDSGMPRLYREAPLNSIWEGSGNVNALDVLRALGREPGTADALLSRARPGARAPTAGWTRRSTGSHAELGRPGADRAAGPAAGRADGAGAAGLAAGPARARRRRRRVLREPARRRLAASRSARCRAAPTSARSSSGRCRTAPEAVRSRRPAAARRCCVVRRHPSSTSC